VHDALETERPALASLICQVNGREPVYILQGSVGPEFVCRGKEAENDYGRNDDAGFTDEDAEKIISFHCF